MNIQIHVFTKPYTCDVNGKTAINPNNTINCPAMFAIVVISLADIVSKMYLIIPSSYFKI